MKRQHATEKAEWNYIREDSYKIKCLEIAFNEGFSLIERGSKIYKVEGANEALLCEPDKPKTIWYETWKILTELNE